MRDRILSNLPQLEDDSAFSSYIFISRRKALGRRIFNEDEVIAALTPLGFSVYLLEEMSYAEQVRLFAQAKIIVAPHGAGLTNLIFANNPIIVELFGAYVGREFANLSRSLGFKYGCLGCASPRGEVRHQDGDMIVDVNQLSKLLEIMKDSY
jgi:capsular polysaccharide biosynthesis protein